MQDSSNNEVTPAPERAPERSRRSLWVIGGSALIAVLWYQSHPRLWLMPDLHSQTSVQGTIAALSPDNPDTTEVPSDGSMEEGSDRHLFVAWLSLRAVTDRIGTPMTVGGAMDIARSQIDRGQARSDEMRRQAELELAAHQAEQAQQDAQLKAKRKAEEELAAAKAAAEQACHEPYDRIPPACPALPRG